ncbi:hypothetical protein CXG81DRAFT_18098 [Caulochytrium protostelioides]|uniref:ADF-H domain-containing protein n=1 Tax=Caulochytrium protostelioides TaxID=1555241 RepID=A0A4P9XA27_9FUNG|nr:hypothetical protein CXG81DRAFT_18098 [Caulochytrium protostelioides]|eukprot:RKP02198.1 hypothetical protein CXG81DRAFT_18098 [Caulochytrium protostelioides]
MAEIHPDVEAAYEDVRNDKTATTWLILQYAPPAEGKTNSDRLVVHATGEGGLSEFVSHLKPDQPAFGYVRLTVGNDEMSRRAKFILVAWCGPDVTTMRRAKLSVHIAAVKSVLKSFGVEIPASDPADLAESTVLTKVQRAMGANYDRQASSY